MQVALPLAGVAKRPGRRRVRTPGLLFIAALPMAVIALFVAVLIFLSFQTGLAGSGGQTLTLTNYTDLLGDSLFYTALINTAVFAVVSIVAAARRPTPRRSADRAATHRASPCPRARCR